LQWELSDRMNLIIYPAIVQFWVLIKGVKKTSMLLGHGLNKAFLVPDSCRATERNSNRISENVTRDVSQSEKTLSEVI
jgi:hypothetical protein